MPLGAAAMRVTIFAGSPWALNWAYSLESASNTHSRPSSTLVA